jgi:hypothetical protein
MRRVRVELLLLQLCALAVADVVYVTDLPIFTSLAPCAQYAVSYQVLGLTELACPQAVTALESCACSQDNNSASVASAIASNILEDCDATDTEDVASASKVFSRQASTLFSSEFSQLISNSYCNQASPGPAITPAPTLVSQYITDLSAYSNLVAPSILSFNLILTLNFIRLHARRALLATLSYLSPNLCVQAANLRWRVALVQKIKTRSLPANV